MKNILLLLAAPLFIKTSQAQRDPPVIKIGSQTWMVKNLDVDHYRNGDKIPEVKDSAEWSKLTSGAWCYYNNDPSNSKTYGKLYNWYAVNDARGLAPKGWHMPSDEEWTILSTALGGDQVAGGKMKEPDTTHWKIPNIDATNSSGFSGLPGGGRDVIESFASVSESGFWWSSTTVNISYAWCRALYNGDGKLYRYPNEKQIGFSVRCLKD